MPNPTLGTLYGVDVAGSMTGGITSQKVNPALRRVIAAADGSPDASYSAVAEADPAIEFSTLTLGLLTTLGMTGLYLSATAVNFWFQAYLEGGTRKTGANHLKLTQTKGMIVPRSVSASQGDSFAMLNVAAIATWDGTNAPFILNPAAALSGTPAIATCYGLGPAYVGGTQIPGVTSITLDFGINLKMGRHDGDVYPRTSGVRSRRPTLRIQTEHMLALSDLGMVGSNPVSFAQYFRKKEAGGVNVADATTEHFKVAGTNCSVHVEDLSANQDSEAVCAIVVQAFNVPTFNAASAIGG